MATGAVVNKIKDFVRLVNADGVKLKKVILFGSYAKNKQTKYSDIDLALVADEFSGVASEDVKLFLRAMRKHYMIQAQTYNTSDFDSDKDPFVREIIRTGVVIA